MNSRNTVLGYGMTPEAYARDIEQSDSEYIMARQEQREYETTRLYRVTEQWHGGIAARVVRTVDTKRKAVLAYNRLTRHYAATGSYPYSYGWEAETMLEWRARNADN